MRLPVSAVFEADGVFLVNVWQDGRVEPRLVELGEQNQRFVEVVAGVSEGEQVMLAGGPPAGDAASVAQRSPAPAGGESPDLAAAEHGR